MSPSRIVMILTLLTFHFLLHYLVVFRYVWMDIGYEFYLLHLSQNASFGKQDGNVMSFGDGHTCRIKGICTVRVKLFDGTMRELKDVRYIPRMTKNLISVGALKVESLRETLGEGVLKISSGSLLVLKGIRRNNVYYLIGSAVIRLALQNS